MNGVLWKWTNYYNGWQPRWFVLKDGILSYFRSEDEVNSGSKGSINLSVCDLNVNTYDSSRFEIIIPGEQKYFLKASNTQERQRWIVALGTGKACHTEPEFQMKDRVGDYCLPLKEINFKESELRVYLELMNRQVCSIKAQLCEDTSPDITAINELTSTLNAACDTFLDSLKDLVSIASMSGATAVPDSPPTHIGSPVFSSLPIQASARSNRRTSVTRHSNGSVPSDCDVNKYMASDQFIPEHEMVTGKSRRETNYLMEMRYSFVDWSYQIDNTSIIPTLDYINSLSSLIHFLDYFPAQPIVSLSNDIKTNIKKLSLKYGTDERKFSDLSKLIVKDDGQMNSPTQILRSLQRVLIFVEYFMTSLLRWLSGVVAKLAARDQVVDVVGNTGQVLRDILIETFDSTMKERLNWLEHGQFKIISESLPSLETFLCHLLVLDCGAPHTMSHLLSGRTLALDQLMVDLAHYCHCVGAVNRHLTHLFAMADFDL